MSSVLSPSPEHWTLSEVVRAGVWVSARLCQFIHAWLMWLLLSCSDWSQVLKLHCAIFSTTVNYRQLSSEQVCRVFEMAKCCMCVTDWGFCNSCSVLSPVGDLLALRQLENQHYRGGGGGQSQHHPLFYAPGILQLNDSTSAWLLVQELQTLVTRW